MMSNTIRHCFNQYGSIFTNANVSSSSKWTEELLLNCENVLTWDSILACALSLNQFLPCCIVNGKHIISVYSDCVHSKSRSTYCNTISSVLLIYWCWYRITIVTTAIYKCVWISVFNLETVPSLKYWLLARMCHRGLPRLKLNVENSFILFYFHNQKTSRWRATWGSL